MPHRLKSSGVPQLVQGVAKATQDSRLHFRGDWEVTDLARREADRRVRDERIRLAQTDDTTRSSHDLIMSSCDKVRGDALRS